MTVSTELSHEEYTGNGVTTDFDFRFRIFEAKHLVVSVAEPDGTERILTNGTDYTLRGVGSYRGGKVILKMPLATGWKIGIARDLPAVQETDLRNQGKFFAEVHEDAFDYLTMLIQKSLGYLSLCLRKPSFISDHYDAKGNKISNLGKPVKDDDAVDLGTMKEHISAKDKRSLRVADKDIPALPNAANRANKLLSFDNNGNPVVIVPESGSAADVLVELGKFGGDKLIGSSHGGTVYSDYAVCEVRRVASFGGGGSVNSSRDAVFFTDESLWYVSKSTIFPVQVPERPDAGWRCIGLLNGYPLYDVRNWGLVGDDFTDNTDNWVQMIQKSAGYQIELYFPAGVYQYKDIGPVTMNRCTWRGDGSMRTIFRCMNTVSGHIALDINAWPDPNDATQPFLDGFNLIGLHVEGNSSTYKVVRLQGNSRCKWNDVSMWGARSTDGIGFSIEACSINQFDSVYVSKYRNLAGQTTNVPFYGLVITTGYRAGAFQASSTDNVFTSCGWEGVNRGCLLTYADGTLMLGGTSESNLEYDLAIQVGCRFNSFINFAMESVAATFNAQDRGEYSFFKNCYSNKLFYIGQNSKSSEISGGYFQHITTQTGSVDAKIHDLTVGHWGAASGDGVDVSLGVGHVIYSIYNKSIPDYVNTTDVRKTATLTTSSVSGGTNGVWDNTTRLPVTFYVGGGTNSFTQALILRGGAGGDYVGIPLSGVQQIHLEAKDRISLTWATGVTAPTCSYRTKRGYN